MKLGNKIHNIVFWLNCLTVHLLYNTRWSRLSCLQFCYMERRGPRPLLLNSGEPGTVLARVPLWRWCCASSRPGQGVDQQFSPWSLRAPSSLGSVAVLLRDHVQRPHDFVKKERSSARTRFPAHLPTPSGYRDVILVFSCLLHDLMSQIWLMCYSTSCPYH